MSAGRYDRILLADRLNEARSFVECAAMAVTEAATDMADADAIRNVLDEAIMRIRAISKEISPSPGEMAEKANP